MNGQMKNYSEYMSQAYAPIDVNTLPYFVDMRGLRDYAKSKGVKIVDLPQEEKEKFLIPNPTVRKVVNQ